jgi:hypothetical protein
MGMFMHPFLTRIPRSSISNGQSVGNGSVGWFLGSSNAYNLADGTAIAAMILQTQRSDNIDPLAMLRGFQIEDISVRIEPVILSTMTNNDA